MTITTDGPHREHRRFMGRISIHSIMTRTSGIPRRRDYRHPGALGTIQRTAKMLDPLGLHPWICAGSDRNIDHARMSVDTPINSVRNTS